MNAPARELATGPVAPRTLTRTDDVDRLLAQTRDGSAALRCAAVNRLCPCHVRHNLDRVWERMLLLVDDPDAKVRGSVLHVLTDGSPREREPQVLQALERPRDDLDPKIRRRARHILAHYRRTGELNIS